MAALYLALSGAGQINNGRCDFLYASCKFPPRISANWAKNKRSSPEYVLITISNPASGFKSSGNKIGFK